MIRDPCPHCRAARERAEELEERVRQLEADLCGAEFAAPAAWGLSAREALVLQLLCRHVLVTRDLFARAVETLDPTWDADVGILDVFVCKMRRKLCAHGVVIETAWGQGYRLAEGRRGAVIAACRRDAGEALQALAALAAQQQAATRRPTAPAVERARPVGMTVEAAARERLRAGPASTPAILAAVRARVRPTLQASSVWQVLDKLAAAGDVVRRGETASGGGRPAVIWALAEGADG